MTSLENVVQKYAIEHYGDLIVPDRPLYEENTKTWKVQLRSTYPRIIRDERFKETIVRFLALADLGTININEKLQIVDATSDDNIEDNLVSRLDLWKQQSEQIVVKASSDVFAKIAESTHVLYPLGLILDVLARHKESKFTILEIEVEEQRRPKKIRQYLQLLEELDIVRKVDNGYTYGNIFVGLMEQTVDEPRKLKTALISHVINRKYSTLRQVFGINQLEPYVRLANAYYWPSLDAEKLVYTTRSRLLQRYQDYYDKVSGWDFETRLSELQYEGAIVEDNGYLIGDKDRFENMLKMKHSSLVLNP